MLRLVQAILPTMLILLVLCCAEYDEPDFDCTDPVGSEDYVAGDNSWMCFIAEMNGCFRIELSDIPRIRSVYLEDHIYGDILDVGTKRCINEITEKPLDGFSFVVPALVNHGYVVRFPDNTYGRFYIDSWTVDVNGEVTALNIIRQKHN